jgi:hypothetical protein
MSSRIIFGLIAVALCFSSCNKRFTGLFNEDVVINEFDFDYLSAKAKIHYSDGQRNLSGTANIRVKKDSAIWISLSPGLGVEVARLLLLKDSVFFIDRISKKYLKTGYREFSNLYDFEFDYQIVQSVIIGNLIYPYKKSELVKDEFGFSYQRTYEHYMITNYIGGESKKLERVEVQDIESKNSISVNYSEFRELSEDAILPYNIKFTLEYLEGDKEITKINIGLNKANLLTKALRFPFNVPEKYKSY